MPVYVVVPCAIVASWNLTGTTVVEGSVNGRDLGRRTFKRWSTSDASDWFLELTAPFCKLANINVGEQLNVSLKLADSEPPAELESLLRQTSALRAAWERLSESARRTNMEHIRSAKSATTRANRAAVVVDKLRATQNK